MTMHLIILLLIILNLGLNSNGADLHRRYSLFYDPLKSREWSDDRALAYITTVQLFNSNHHVFQYRHYPCQYFYTDEIQVKYNNETETINECIYNTTTSDYEYNFQLHLDSHHIDPYILRNLAIQCKYKNCSLSLLTMKYIRIGWNLQGNNNNNNNSNCSFDTTQRYAIYDGQYKLSEWITLHCKSLFACNRSKYNLVQALLSNVQLIYGSSYELQTPYCSLEKSLAYIIEANFAQTNRLLEQLVDTIQRGFGKPNEREQAHMKEYVVDKWTNSENRSTKYENISTTHATEISGVVQGMFKYTK